jgi:hypothetical protein
LIAKSGAPGTKFSDDLKLIWIAEKYSVVTSGKFGSTPAVSAAILQPQLDL